MEWIRFIIAALCISGGVFVMISAAIGVYRFSECLTRMHSAAMGDTLGLGLILLGLVVLFGFCFTTVKIILVIVFLWTTSPVSSHLIAQMMVEKKKKKEEEGKMK
ncbi:MAG: cation:proton antiporter [Eubacterium sp.]